jgi:hypothetical protein
VIRGLEQLSLVSNVKVPDEAQLGRRRLQSKSTDAPHRADALEEAPKLFGGGTSFIGEGVGG